MKITTTDTQLAAYLVALGSLYSDHAVKNDSCEFEISDVDNKDLAAYHSRGVENVNCKDLFDAYKMLRDIAITSCKYVKEGRGQ